MSSARSALPTTRKTKGRRSVRWAARSRPPTAAGRRLRLAFRGWRGWRRLLVVSVGIRQDHARLLYSGEPHGLFPSLDEEAGQTVTRSPTTGWGGCAGR